MHDPISISFNHYYAEIKWMYVCMYTRLNPSLKFELRKAYNTGLRHKIMLNSKQKWRILHGRAGIRILSSSAESISHE